MSLLRPFNLQNNFGANIGGPIWMPKFLTRNGKHRSFFYFNWEAFRAAGGAERSYVNYSFGEGSTRRFHGLERCQR